MSSGGAFFLAIGIVWVICAGLYWLLKSVMVSTSLQKKFQAAGNLRGRTRADIVEAVGLPNQIDRLPDGRSLQQWRQINSEIHYVITLIFDARGVCEGVSHESAGGVR